MEYHISSDQNFYTLRKVIDTLFKKYRVDLIGTDMHNLDTRASHIDEAAKIIKKRYGKDTLDNILNNSKKLV